MKHMKAYDSFSMRLSARRIAFGIFDFTGITAYGL